MLLACWFLLSLTVVAAGVVVFVVVAGVVYMDIVTKHTNEVCV